MKFDLEQILNFLIQKRTIVLGVIGAILAIALLSGLLYQKKNDKSNEAAVMFDEAWQQVSIVMGDIQQQPNYTYLPGDQRGEQATALYRKGLANIDLLVTDYPETVSGARAAILYKSVIDIPYLNALIDDQDLLTRMKSSDYLSTLQKKHKNFWGVVIDVSEGVRKEQQGLHEDAIICYQKALKKDSKKYMSDYILIAIARNYEIRNNKTAAIEYYQKLINQYPNSIWINFAMAKVYTLSESENLK